MATGYVRQSAADIVSGEVVRAAPLNNEFNAIRDAFSTASGHNHDGTTGGGAYISTVSDSDNDTKVVADGTTNSVQVSTAGTERMRVNSSGNVGIGTTAPAAKLEVRDVNGTIIASNSATRYGFMQWENTVGALRFGTDGSFPIRFDTASTERMRIDASGATSIVNTLKIGNGAASNSARLMVNTLSGTAAGIQLFQDGNESWVMESVPGSTALRWSNSGAERMRLDGVGNVGINTNAPGSTLDMRGPNGLGVRYIETATGNTNRIQFGTGAGFGYIDATAGIGSPSLVLQTASTERMRIDASGNVGIGVTPASGPRLQVQQTTPAATPTWSAVDALAISGAANTVVQLHAGNSSGSLAYAFAVGSSRSVGAVAYDSANNALFFSANNTERMRIDASGNVGIGRTPNYTLDVGGSMRSLVAGGGTLLLGDSQNTVAIRSIPGAGDSGLGFYTQALAGNAERMRIDASGNVGIGVTPLHRLHSLAAADGAVSLGIGSGTGDTANGSRTTEIRALSGNGTFFQNLNIQANEIRALTVGSERMRIDASGNVGIGTALPQARMHVDGTAFVNSSSTLPALGTALISGEVHAGISNLVSADSGVLRLSAGGGTTLSAKVALDLFREAGGAAGIVAYTAGAERMRIDASGNVISNVNTTAPTLSVNQQMVFALTSNTNLRISVRGTDGVTRVANITLA